MKSKFTWVSKILASTLSAFVVLGAFSVSVFAGKYKGELHKALARGVTTKHSIEKMLDDHPDWINQYDTHELLPIHYAVMFSTPDVLQVLLDHGADLNDKGLHGRTALDILLENVSGALSFVVQEEWGFSPSIGAHEKNVDWLVAHRAKFSDTTSTPFHLKRASNGMLLNNLELLTHLVETGYPFDIEDNDGATPFLVALSKISDFGLADRISAYVGTLVKYGSDISHKDHKGRTAFHYFAESDVEYYNFDSNACCAPETHYRGFYTEKPLLPVLDALLKAGVDVNAKDTDGATPLHLAAQLGNTNAIRWLIKLGANPDVIDNNGKRPIDLTVSSKDLKQKYEQAFYPPGTSKCGAACNVCCAICTLL